MPIHSITTPESPTRSCAHGDGTEAADTESDNISKVLDNTFVHGLPGDTPQCAVEFARYDPFLLEAKRVLRQKGSCEASLAFFFESALSAEISSNLASVDACDVSDDMHTKRDTYISLANKAALVARFMHIRLGICSGDLVGILSTNSVEVLILHYACALLRAPLLNLNTHLVSHELKHILDDSAAVTIFARQAVHGKTLRDALEAQETEKCPTQSIVWLPEQNLTTSRKLSPGSSRSLLRLTTKPVSPGGNDHMPNIVQFEWHDDALHQEIYHSTLKSKKEIASETICFSDLSDSFEAIANNPAHVYYTSGTTGAPKGVALSQAVVHKHTVAITVEMGLNSADIWMHAAPIFHLVDAFAVYAVSWVGARHVIVPQFRTEEVLLLMERESITATNLASTMVTLLYHNPMVGSTDLSSLRIISCGGSPLGGDTSVARAIALFGCEFFISYGMTECCGKISMSKLSLELCKNQTDLAEQLAIVSTSGRPFILVDIKVIDSTGNPVAYDAKTVGEVWVRGPTVFNGYMQNHGEVEAKVFDKEGWFCTGDLACVRSDGYICLVGRMKDVILCGGENVYTSEVEAALHTHPGVEQAAVFGVPHTIMGELVQAVVTLRKDGNKIRETGDLNQGTEAHQVAAANMQLSSNDPIRDITMHCRRRLSGYKVPTEVYVVTELPTNANGKVLKRKLRDFVTNGTLSPSITVTRRSTSKTSVHVSLHDVRESDPTVIPPEVLVDCGSLSHNSFSEITAIRCESTRRVIILDNPDDVCIDTNDASEHITQGMHEKETHGLNNAHQYTWLLSRTVPAAKIFNSLVNCVSSLNAFTCIITVDTDDESQAARACSLVYATSQGGEINTFLNFSGVAKPTSLQTPCVEKENKVTSMSALSCVFAIMVSMLCSHRLIALPLKSRTTNILDVVLQTYANDIRGSNDGALKELMEPSPAQSTRCSYLTEILGISSGAPSHFPSSTSFDTKSTVDLAVRNVLDLLPDDPSPDMDIPLMSCGLTSLGAIRLRDALNTTLQQVLSVIDHQDVIPATLAFDFPSTRAICNFIETLVKVPSAPAPFSNTTASLSPRNPQASGDIPLTTSIVGAESISPGCSTSCSMITSASTSTDLKGCSEDNVCMIPSSRWDLDSLATFDNLSLTPCFGAFVNDVDKYDAEAIGMSANEAAVTDPQQRLVLDACALLWLFPDCNSCSDIYHGEYPSDKTSFANRERSCNPCRISACGVIVGVSQVEYPRLAEKYRETSRFGSYDATGAHLSVIAGRVAFTLAFSGPAAAIDTACSSSLVAVVHARAWLTGDVFENIGVPEGRESLVGGVNLIFDAAWSLKCNAARMLSSDGRCKALDSSADGYVRAEACGMLRLVNEAKFDNSRSNFHVVLAGAVANQDGRSSSLTAPNGPAQNEVICDTLRVSSSAEPVTVLQLHGTGTMLGDPIEMSAALSALSSSQ